VRVGGVVERSLAGEVDPSLNFSISKNCFIGKKFLFQNAKFGLEIMYLGQSVGKIDIFSTYIFYARNLQNFIGKFKFPSATSAAARMLLRCFTLLV